MKWSALTGRRVWISVGLAIIATAPAQQGQNTITVHVDRPGIKISPTFYGLMTEEINHSYDGGIYAELIQNRSFRDSHTKPNHWSVVHAGSSEATISIVNDSPGDVPLGVSLRMDTLAADDADRVGIANDGYWGIPVKPHTTYQVSFFAKTSVALRAPLTVSLEKSQDAKILAEAQAPVKGDGWHKYSLKLRTGGLTPSTDNVFAIRTADKGTIWFRDVSLFPPTFKHRPNGNRIDLMNLLGEMKPSFLRLPGGNYLEGNTIAERFEWKDTIGNPASRPGHIGPWGYRSSDGLGLLEFLEWCEDLHMQPVLAIYAGYSLGGQHVEPGPNLTPYVQDALDEIEYVTGGADTRWGGERARDGHPKPFPLTYVEIGNEDWFDRSGSYGGRYAQFFDSIKARWPKLQLIATAPVHTRKPDVIDDHYYRSASEMARDSGHYDNYDRKGTKVFVGEWASIGGNPTPTFKEALGDAAWLTGLERDSDVVVMESYAPLLVNVNPGGHQWPTNLIGFDGLTSFGSPSYYVQSLFAKNTGDTVLPVQIQIAQKPPVPVTPHGAVGLGTWSTDAEYKDVQVVSGGKTIYSKDFASGSEGWTLGAGTWKVEDGSLRQSSNRRDTHATAGDPDWTHYSYLVKAKKLGGAEGFLVLFHVKNSRDYLQWNIGGWGNTRSVVQRHEDGELDELGAATDTKVETGRWYDVRIDVRGDDIKCYLDNHLISEATETPRPPGQPLYAAASIAGGHDVYLKVVNVSSDAMTTRVDLAGVAGVSRHATGWILTGNPEDANSVAEPFKVAPKAITVESGLPTFSHTFPAHSVTVIRFEVKN